VIGSLSVSGKNNEDLQQNHKNNIEEKNQCFLWQLLIIDNTNN
jgi:hypothetical protein